MKAFLALVKREHIEHRAAFVYAPAAILLIFTVAIFSAVLLGRLRVEWDFGMPGAGKFFEIGFMGMAGFWWIYLLPVLFFYFADAFSADRRNNAMLFWKSMPQSDLKILGTKTFAGLVAFPALVFLAMLATGVVLMGVSAAMALRIDQMAAPDPVGLFSSFFQVSAVALAFLIFALVWYAPFYVWVGGLSTVFGRWSIPLAFLIPALLGLFENLLFFGDGPDGGYVFSFLNARSQFAVDREIWQAQILSETPLEASVLIGNLISNIDWVGMATGILFAGIVLYLASEYRRRVID
ncbi:hypothetical protein EMQ25_15535 [Arsenicitalea aurantiaca]|uniref:Uncharacterized protein n=1 Tax=Arsenicitalea aurantiaca TaxID=1783274 RepID=A0A433X408_9HYPH|nr:hypothetical protein [Arsenicitalea aurantiaca]RUT28799.1 hypothetical protein EMQ25_15535 [Arsenicitalea aurantiaca]